MIQVLAIPGSLRKASANKTLLQVAAQLAPAEMKIEIYEGIGLLPYFNPDLEMEESMVLGPFRAKIKTADGILISSPEYAHGVPGCMKNALDWLVGGSEVVGKPVALWNASLRATYAQTSLEEILATMSTRLIREAFVAVPLLGKTWTVEGVLTDPEISKILRAALEIFGKAI